MKFIRPNNFGYIFSIYENDYNKIFLSSPSDSTLLTLPDFSVQNLSPGTNDIPEPNAHDRATDFYVLLPTLRFLFTETVL